MKTEFQNLIKETIDYTNSSQKINIILSNFVKNSFLGKIEKAPKTNNTEYKNKEIWEILRKFEREYKIPYKNLLIEIVRLSKNPENMFDKEVLENFGFSHCQSCSNRKLAELMKEQIGIIN